jgi:hypothetical protein
MELPELTQLDPATTVGLRLRPTPESLAGRAEPRVDAAITSAATCSS